MAKRTTRSKTRVSIYIKPSHRGALTKRAERNGRTTLEQAKVDIHSQNPRIRKQGRFALNARKWQHKRKTNR